jgi:hypothetical protein
MSRFWALTVETDTGGTDEPLAAELADVAGVVEVAVGVGLSEQPKRTKLMATNSKTRKVFI